MRNVNGQLPLSTLMDDAAILSLEHQFHLQDVLGEHNWRVDMNAPVFEFTFPSGETLTCENFHFLGSAAPGPASWMWAWANPSGFPEGLTRLAGSVHDLGERHGVAELTSAEVPFGDLPGAPDMPHDAVGPPTEAAKVLTGRWTSYNGEVGGGTRASFLVEHPAFRLPAPAPARIVGLLQQAVSGLPLTDHRRAVYTYGHLRGLDPAFGDDGARLTLSAEDLALTVSFDEYGRVENVEDTLGRTVSGPQERPDRQ